MQKIYNYDKDGIYVGEGYASLNPRIKGEYLLPANSTIIEMPSLSENQKVRFNKIKNKWEVYAITATTKNIVVDDELKVIRDMNLEEQIKKGIVSLLETQKLNDDKTEIIDKTYFELIKETVITEIEAKEKIIEVKRNERNSEMKIILNNIDKYKNEKEQLEFNIISELTISKEEYKNLLRKLQELRDFQNYINFDEELLKEYK